MNGTADKNAGSDPGHLLIGLTGGIGSGKSTVTTLFEKLGARIIDTDLLSRELTQSGGAAIPSIQESFGASYLDPAGALDRDKMRALVFANPAAKQQLETILHPLILKRARQLAGIATLAPYTLVVIPLLFEVPGYQNWLRRTLVVDCPEEMQIARTVQRSGLDRAMVQAIISQQIARNRRIELSDDIICNDQDLPALSARVAQLHQLFLQIASGSD